MPQLKDGIDFVTGNVLSFQQMNRMKNNWYSGATPPANPVNGMVWVKNDGIAYVYFGAAWVDLLGILKLTGATYENVQDFINATMSSGRISGGAISDDLDGTITVATGTGFIKSNAASSIEDTYFFDWPASTIVPLVDGEVNYIYVEYNAGTPRAWSTIDRTTINLTDQFTLGRVFKDGADLHIINSGTNLENHIRRNHERLVATRWIEQASGGVISEPAALKLKSTAGVFYIGAERITTAGKDTNVADTFDAWYRDGGGGWTLELAQTDVNIEKYDDGDGVLGDIPANKYSARYIYICFEGRIYVQYGQQADKLAIIQAEPVPAPPAFLNEFCILAARVIVKDGVSPLVEVAGAYGNFFQYQGITEHGDLAGVTSDQHHAQIHAPSHIAGAGDPLAWASTKTTGAWAKSIGGGGDYADWATMIADMPDLIAHAVTITIKAGTTLTEECELRNKRGVATAALITIQAEKYFPTSGSIPTADSATATTLRDADLAAAALGNNYFNGCWIFITAGTGKDNGFVLITDYVDATGDVVVAAWPGTQPDNTSKYIIVGAMIDGLATTFNGFEFQNNRIRTNIFGIGIEDTNGRGMYVSQSDRVDFTYSGIYGCKRSGILVDFSALLSLIHSGIVGNNTNDGSTFAGVTVSSMAGQASINDCGISDNNRWGILVTGGGFAWINACFGAGNGNWGTYCNYSGQAQIKGAECSGAAGNHSDPGTAGNANADQAAAY